MSTTEHRSEKNTLALVGNRSQLGFARTATLTEGRGRGMRIIDIRSGTGLDVTLLPDRGLDVADVFFRGVCLSYLTPNGLTSAVHYDPNGVGWLDGFSGGLITTCGLSHLGAPSEDQGQVLGQHGRYSSIPATGVSIEEISSDGEPCFRVRGTVEECRLFGTRLRLERTITVGRDRPFIRLEDRATNFGFEAAPFTILYHMNTGYPLLNPQSRLYTSAQTVRTFNDPASEASPDWAVMREPAPGATEEMFLHRFAGRTGHAAHALLVADHRQADLALHFCFDESALPFLSQWKSMRAGDYVLGIEPGNVPVAPRAELREKGLLPMLEPGGTWSSRMDIEAVAGADDVAERIGVVESAGVAARS